MLRTHKRREFGSRRVRLTLLAGAVVLLLALLPRVFQRGSFSSVAARSATAVPSTYRCGGCAHVFEMDAAEARRQVRAGRARTEPGMLAQFACPACGESEAVLHESMR